MQKAPLHYRAAREDTPVEDESGDAVAQSVYTEYADLAKHGYIEEAPHEPFTLEPLRDCLRGLGVDDRLEDVGGNNVRVFHVHGKGSVVNGETYCPTQAYFSQLVNRKEGVLIAASNMVPAHRGLLEEPPVMTFPPLHFWSDVVFLQMLAPTILSSSSPPPSSSNTLSTTPKSLSQPNLNFIIRYCCQNHTTVTVIRHILALHKIIKMPEWPGIEFNWGTDDYYAMIGTPHGAGVAHLLGQHTAQLGKKMVEKVTVFYAPNREDIFRWPSLVFWVNDIPVEKRAGENDEADRLLDAAADMGSVASDEESDEYGVLG